MDLGLDQAEEFELALSALGRDWARLGARLRTLEHDVATECRRLTLQLHYPALRDARATVAELVDVIRRYLPHFCLPRQEVTAVYERKDELNAFDFHEEVSVLNCRALDLFMRAQEATGRSGEAGELLLYLLTEWMLEAPQIVAKMSLKTNRDMPVHGSDGIHVKYVPETGQLVLYSGEAKLHGRLGDAIRSAIRSIRDALEPEKVKHELALVRRDLDLSGLSSSARVSLLSYLNPMNERSNQRVDAITCLIGFDFSGYAAVEAEANAEAVFRDLALTQLRGAATAFAKALCEAGMANRRIELFLLPLPSVDQLRKLFAEALGQRSA